MSTLPNGINNYFGISYENCSEDHQPDYRNQHEAPFYFDNEINSCFKDEMEEQRETNIVYPEYPELLRDNDSSSHCLAPNEIEMNRDQHVKAYNNVNR